MKVKNPILTGFNPDPSIVKANNKFYIATSTFEVFPGICIHESEDLVNWKLIAHPLDNLDILNMKGNYASCGVWAPDITFKDDTFYIVFTDVKTFSRGPFKDTPNFIIKSKSIYGPWDGPYYINSSGFDPSLFHDDDGKSYFVNMEWDFRQGRGSPCFTGILAQEINLEKMELTGEVHKIFKGTDRGFVEGPHIYKKDSYYYLLCAEGGTGFNHAESVARAKSIFGPYETHPNKLLISALNTDSPLQRAGHASLVDAGDNGWYIAHLCSRPLKDNRCILGRETALQNIIWEDGWPYLKDKTIIPNEYYEVNANIEKIDYNKYIKYECDSKQFNLDFQTLRIPMDNYVIKTKDSITLIGQESVNSLHYQNTWQRRQQHLKASFKCRLQYNPTSFQHMAGLIYRYQEGDLYLLYLTYDEEKGTVLRLFTENEYQVNYYDEVIIPVKNDIYLKCEVINEDLSFFYSYDDKEYIKLDITLDASLISDQAVKHGGFTGAFFGIHACDMQYLKKEAKFSDIIYQEIK